MVALSLQTLLLMGGAYLLGAIVACAARRTLSRAPAQPSATAERRVDPLPEMVQGGAALLVEPAAEPRPPVPETAPPVEPEPAPVKPATPTATLALPAQGRTARAGPRPASRASTRRSPPPSASSASPLRADRRLDAGRYRARRQSLGQQGRINQENWIEQAQILAKGGETHYASRRAAARPPTPSRPRRRRAPSDRTGRGRDKHPARARSPSPRVRQPAAPRRWPPRSSRRSCAAARAPAGTRHAAEARDAGVSSRRGEPRRLRGAAPHHDGGRPETRSRRDRSCHGCARRAPSGAGRADPPGRADGARQPAAHRRHRRPDRAAPRRPGRHPLFPDRALVAGRRRALRTPLGTAAASPARTGSSRRRS